MTGLAWSDWSFEPLVAGLLACTGGGYGMGVVRLWRHAGGRRGLRWHQVTCFWLGWALSAFALLGPIDGLADDLFSAHMVQHELLMVAAAPLLVLGHPVSAWAWALPRDWRAPVGRVFHSPGWRVPWIVITRPMSAWWVHAAALWLWHLPALFEAALHHEAVHDLQHACFLATALLFWWSVVGTAARQARGKALLSLFTTMAHTGALGALLAFSRVPWYPSYGATVAAHGLTALQDQQVGGLIMWVPPLFVYLAAGLVIVAQALSPAGQAALASRPPQAT